MKFKILVVMKNITCTGFIASVIIQKWFYCRETHKLNTIDTEYRASISLWRLKAFLVINFSIYEGRKIIFCQKTFGKVGTFQSLGKVGTVPVDFVRLKWMFSSSEFWHGQLVHVPTFPNCTNFSKNKENLPCLLNKSRPFEHDGD